MTEARRALVTGAARGIGAADRRAPGRGRASRCSRSIWRAGCDIALDVARDAFPPLADVDVCVANAGITTTIAPAHRMTAEQWQRDIDVNLTGRLPHRAGLPRRDARARLWTNRGGLQRGRRSAACPGRSHTPHPRPASWGWCARSPARTPAHGITVNAVLPGLVATEQVLAMPAAGARAGATGAAERAHGASRAEIAAAVAFLAGEEAAQINGQAIAIDGAASLNQLSLGSERG